MNITEVRIQEKFLNLLAGEISTLYPPQEHAIRSGLLEGKNLVIATPTASGKTLIAELAITKNLENGKKAIYVVPLKALAYEKFIEFKKYEKIGYNVRLEIGDLDSEKYFNKLNFDILIATAEKLDSILRSTENLIENVGILVMDEIHMLVTDRGPVYEIIIAKFRKLFPKIQILALSATIGNAGELADWLNAGLVESEWRPVELKESIAVGKKFETIKEISSKTISENGQLIIFVNSRRSAEALAEKIAFELEFHLDKEKLFQLSEEILNAASSPTKQCKKLSECVKKGIAFHHAGLLNKQRILVEDSFRNFLIKIIVTTPTLAFGVNLPSRVVIIRDIQRYGNYGYEYIPVLEYKQMSGRAGRPKYDNFGEAITIAKNDTEKEFLTEKYIFGEIEPIYSQLGIEPVLRFHILAAIASGFSRTYDSLIEFLRMTFFSYQYGLHGVEKKIRKILLKLHEWDFIEYGDKFLIPTKLGKRVSDLYIDPETAHTYIKILKNSEEKKKKFFAIGLLEMLCDSTEMPLLSVSRNEEQELWITFIKDEDKLLREGEIDSNFLERFKTAKLFDDWINEVNEDKLLEKYNAAPGILHQKLEILEWLTYSASELAKLCSLRNSEKELRKLEIRIKYGVKEELIPLVGIRGIGRVRARILFNSGIKDVKTLKETPSEKLSKLLGKKVAENIKENLL
ncbi:MAG: DEAD/DEAH box helicase [Candidatus Altiarchaeota archaeon]